jgi:hypothetical protein
MTYIRKKVKYTYYTGISSTNLWSNDYNDRKVYASEEDADSEMSTKSIVGIVTDSNQQF